MKKGFLLLLFIFIVSGFFYKTIFNKYVPFPGDLLVSEYNPWKSYSFLGYNPGSYPNKAQYFDALRQIYPWKTFSINSLKKASFPLWNPYNFSGAPLLANFQSAVLYPFNFLYLHLPQIWAWSILVILQPLLALFFTFLYCRKIGISGLGAFFAGISFAFSSFMTVWLEYNTIGHVILWLPLILLAIEKLFEKKTITWSIILIFSIISSLFAGHIQIFAYLLIFVLIYSFLRIRKISLFIISLFALSLGIGAVQLFPGIELIIQAARSAHTYDLIVNKILIQPWQLVMLFVPDFFGNPATRNYWIQDTYVGDVIYIGLIPLFFVIFSFFIKDNFFTKFFTLTTAALFILITLNPLTQLIYRLKLPLISASSSNLLVFLICFSMSMLCGFGVDIFLKNKYSLKRYLQAIAPLLLIFFLIWLVTIILPRLHLFDWESNLVIISLRNLLYSTTVFISIIVLFFTATINNKIKHFVVICLLLISLFDSWRYFQKFNPFSPVEFTFPKVSVLEFIKDKNGIDRYWGYGSAIIEANFATQNFIFSPDGYDPLYPKRYGEFIQSSKDGKIHKEFSNQTRSDAVLNFDQKKVLNLLGVKYILDRYENASTQKIFPPDQFSLVYGENGWKIFDNKEALPRAFLVSDYKVAKTSQEFEKTFFANDFNLLETVVLEEHLEIRFNDLNHQSNVEMVSYSPNEVKLKTSADGNRLLFLSDTYYPGWKAYVDGQETKIYRADYTFRAIVVDSGKHNIKFSYEPLSFKIGCIISLVSLISLIILLFTIKKRRYDI